MSTIKINKKDILLKAGMRINNSLSDEQIKNVVALFGYPEEKLLEGKALLTAADNLYEAQIKEYGDVDAAQENYKTLKQQAHKNYMRHLTIARIVFKNNVQAQTTLQINGRRSSTVSGWIKQCSNFYHALLAKPDWIALMAAYGQTQENLASVLQDIDAVMLAAETVNKEKGDAQNATAVRDQKFEELVEWLSDYEQIARIALAETPQLLEKLGIVVKS